MSQIPGLYIENSGNKGRSVLTALDIPEGSTVEVCPVLVIPEKEVDIIHKTTLHDYYFRWGEKLDQAAIALGFGSIYNHSNSPNTKIILDIPSRHIIIESTRFILAGEELTFNYIDDEQSKDQLWFNVK